VRVFVCVCVCVCARAREGARPRTRAPPRVCVRVRACVCVRVWLNPLFLPPFPAHAHMQACIHIVSQWEIDDLLRR
jgi:hypothetical protein